MTTMKYTQPMMLFIALGLTTTTATAQPYALIEGGVAIGQLSTSTFHNAVNTWLNESTDSPSGSVSDSSNSSVFRLGAGYQFTERLAVEASYESLGSYNAGMTLTAQNMGGDTARAQIKEQVSVNGLGVRLVGNYPISNGITLLGGVGLSYLNNERKNTVNMKLYDPNPFDPRLQEGSISKTVGQVSPSIGLGMSVDLTKDVSLRGWYGRYFNAASTNALSDFHIDTVTAGLVVRW